MNIHRPVKGCSPGIKYYKEISGLKPLWERTVAFFYYEDLGATPQKSKRSSAL
jgi:hypothetical protein